MIGSLNSAEVSANAAKENGLISKMKRSSETSSASFSSLLDDKMNRPLIKN